MISTIMNYYYRMTSGFSDERLDNITKSTIEYLIDNNYSTKEIINIIEESNIEESFNPSSLPDSLWENSLIQRDVFYYHNSLHIKSKPPTWDPETLQVKSEPFFLEMKIRYTMDDLLDYYYNKCNIDVNLRDKKRDSGAFEFMMNRYKKIEDMQPLDFMLLVIDEAANSDNIFTNPLKLQDYEGEVVLNYKVFLAEAKVNNANKIIWRNSNV